MAALKLLIDKEMVGKILLIAPLRVCYNVWPNEIQKWADFADLRIVLLHGPKREQALASDADIYIINPEGLEWLFQAKKVKITSTKTGRTITKIDVDVRRWKKLGFDALVIDELSKFKHTNTNRFKLLREVIGTFARRWGLTGSPAARSLEDLFGQCYLLDQGRSLGQYITHYRMKYFMPSHTGFGWTIRPGQEKQIYERIKPLALRMAAEDYIDMPQLIENNIFVDLPDSVMKVYKQLEDDLITMIENRTVTASTAGVASGNCRQIVAGGLYVDQQVKALIKLPKSQREWINLHTEKIDAVADLIDELQGSPLLVAYDFNHDLDRLRTRFGKNIPIIGRGVDPKLTNLYIQQWNAGELPYIFAHPASAAYGLDGLQHVGQHIAWHSLTYNFELYDQFIRRIRRQGNTKKHVFVHHIIAKGTIDHAMLISLKSKEKNQNAFFEALKKMRGV